ncbi:hypothetical protein ACFLRW_00870 [Acidobacteriota bacterium]
MGQAYRAKCKDCGNDFTDKEGGGFYFHLLRCDKCGKSKEIGFDEIGEPHLRYIKGLGGPYSVASSQTDKMIQEEYPGDSITESEYHREIEKLMGQCKCGGQHSFDAPPRCPGCNSINIEKGDVFMMYD